MAVWPAMRLKFSGVTSTSTVVAEPVPLDLGLRLWLLVGRRLVDCRDDLGLVGRGFGQDLVVRMRLEVGVPRLRGHRPCGEVERLAVEVDPHGVARVGHLAVRGEERVLDGGEQRAGLDPLLFLDEPYALQDLLAHDVPPAGS